MSKAIALSDSTKYERNTPAIGVFVAGDPRIDAESRQRCVNICKMVADTLAERVKLPDGSPAKVVWAPMLVDGEAQADIVAKQFQDAGVKVLVCAPDTWAFPQLSVISLLQQFPTDTPINFTCGNSGPKPGVVFAHAVNGALAQYGRLSHLNVGTWPDTGLNPEMTEGTAQALVDWASAAVTTQALKGRRVVIFGHDSMGMETALAHVIPTRQPVRPRDHPAGHEAAGRHAQQEGVQRRGTEGAARRSSTATSASGWSCATPWTRSASTRAWRCT